MNVEFFVGFMIGLLLVLICSAILLIKNKKKREYDERQKLARGKAGITAFFSMLVVSMLDAVLIGITEFNPLSTQVHMMLLGIFGCTVFVIVCIMSDAYFTLRDNPKQYVILFIALGIVNLGITITNYISKDSSSDAIEMGIANIASAALCFAIVITFGIKNHMNKLEEEKIDNEVVDKRDEE